ncbi:MAG: PQQ-binding-like beta-propeller repeat protein [Verrucomicrobiota bacterium]
MNLTFILIAVASIFGWRTDGTGRYPDAKPPIEWAPGTNIVWATKLTNWSNASPVLAGDRLFVCVEPTTLICVNAADGKIRWERTNTYADAFPADAAQIREAQQQAEVLLKELGEAEKAAQALKKKCKDAPDDKELAEQETTVTGKMDGLKKRLAAFAQWRLPATHSSTGHSSGTPVTDGKFVYALFGNGLAACYDVDGNRQWIKLVEKPTAGWGQSSSPVLVDSKLILLIHSLHALDAQTGDPLWRAASKQRWGSPVVTRIGQLNVVVTPGGDVVRVSDGKVLVTGFVALEYNAPIVDAGIVYFIQNDGKAVKLVPDDDGVKAETLWTTNPKKERYYSSPVMHKGLLYAINQKAEFSVIDAATGTVVYEQKLALTGIPYSSITLAGGHLYVSSETGTTIVLDPGREPKEIARNTLGKFRSTPVFEGERMFLRAFDQLYCVGKP